jgi:hypothetical protein
MVLDPDACRPGLTTLFTLPLKSRFLDTAQRYKEWWMAELELLIRRPGFESRTKSDPRSEERKIKRERERERKKEKVSE